VDCFRWQIVRQPRKPNRFSLSKRWGVPEWLFVRTILRTWWKSWHFVGVRDQKLATTGREFTQHTPVDLQELHNLLQRAPDLCIDLVSGYGGEGGR
jgi:hypothetical protein